MYERKNFKDKDILYASDMNKIEDAICQFSNPNLLINGDFRVNQRGLNVYAPSKNEITYTVDRWCIFPSATGSGFTLTVNDGYVTFANTNSGISAFMCQFLETPLKGMYTVSVKVKSLTKAVAFTVRDNGTFINLMTLQEGVNTATINATNLDCVRFNISQLSIDIEWVKVEAGTLGTPYSPRPYVEELALCKRYYQIYNNVSFPLSMMSGTVMFGGFNYEKEMRTTPTVTVKSSEYLDWTLGKHTSATGTGKNGEYTNNKCVIVQGQKDSTSNLAKGDVVIGKMTVELYAEIR